MKKEKNIGILNEHTLHLALKNYIEPNPEYHEKEIGGFIADIERMGKIYEIETCSFTNIKKKLPEFLKTHTVTVVYPIAQVKWIIRIDAKTSEMSKKRKSPKKGRPSDCLKELYKLSEFLSHPNFNLKIIISEITEYTLPAGRNRYGRTSRIRCERIPDSFISELDFTKPSDYKELFDEIPCGEFVTSEFAKQNRLLPRQAWAGVKILESLGIIQKCGMKGKAVLYRRA